MLAREAERCDVSLQNPHKKLGMGVHAYHPNMGVGILTGGLSGQASLGACCPTPGRFCLTKQGGDWRDGSGR